ncbi:MAG: glycosyltransferase family 2 protein [Lachnospiraceae bacterium]|nr:glycosyltransferase family 2 protein [Lachnospiraceae bacterium]
MDKKLLTLVVPSYNEEEAIPLFYEEALRVEKELTDIDIEYLFVDDGSRDETMRVVKELNARDPRVHYVSFSRNFGKEAAIYAGLENAAGDYVAILDADLQDPPSLLPEMLEAVENEGYDCVGSRRVTRKGEPPIRSFFARCFYKLMGKISSSEVVDGARDFQLMNRKVVNAILAMGEYNRFSKGIFGWVGFKKKWLEYENVERAAGETKWSFWKLFVYALDGIVAFSTAPLVIASFMGMLFCLIAFIAIIFIIIRTVIFGDPTSGWPSMVCIIMLVSGIQLLCIGILGQYLAKTYLETKKRPLYLVEEAVLANDKVIK